MHGLDQWKCEMGERGTACRENSYEIICIGGEKIEKWDREITGKTGKGWCRSRKVELEQGGDSGNMTEEVGRGGREEQREKLVGVIREWSLREVTGEKDVTGAVMWEEQQQVGKAVHDTFGLGAEKAE